MPFASALPAIAARQAAIIAAARAVFQTLSIVHFLYPVTTVRWSSCASSTPDGQRSFGCAQNA
jgi:hypothetical protein